MNRIFCVTVFSLVAMTVFAADSPKGEQEMFIATTGQIVKINARARTMLVRGSEGPAIRDVPPIQPTSWQRMGVKGPGIRIPGCITIALPGRSGKAPQSKPTPDTTSLDEYTVVTTNDTVFQDGADPIQFEDFKSGETISIHGILKGMTLTASRVAKWN
jgi:hypothetical protein